MRSEVRRQQLQTRKAHDTSKDGAGAGAGGGGTHQRLSDVRASLVIGWTDGTDTVFRTRKVWCGFGRYPVDVVRSWTVRGASQHHWEGLGLQGGGDGDVEVNVDIATEADTDRA